MNSIELRAKRFKIAQQVDELSSKKNKTPEDLRQIELMDLEVDTLDSQIKRMERATSLDSEMLETMRNGGQPRPRGRRAAEREIQNKTFNAWLRGGLQGLGTSDAMLEVYENRFMAAQSTSSDVAGGFTVPQGFFGKIVEAEKAYGGMINAAFVMETETGNAIPVPTDNDTANVGVLLSENTQTPSQDISFGAVTMNAFTYTSKEILVSNQLLQDSEFDLEGFLSEKMGTRIGRATNTHFTTGTGAAQPTGILTSAVLGWTAGGSPTSGSTTNIAVDDLTELEHSVDPAYRKGASFMMADSAVKVIKKLKDSIGRSLWLPGLAAGEPDTINGYPYVINQDFPNMAPSAKSIAFGNFMNYYVRRVVGVQVKRLTERYADFNQVAFIAFQRWDGQLVDAGTHPIRYLQNSAS